MAYVPNLSFRRVYWSSQDTIGTFVPLATNSAGSFDIPSDGTVVCGIRTKTASLIWTTTDVWGMTFIGQPFVYSFRQEGTNCGIVSQRAAVLLDTGAYWMGNGKFFRYDGFVSTILCDVADYVFGSFNQSLASTVWALANPLYNEITWFYPNASATTVPNSYVTYNYVEGHWAFGSLTRCCGVTQWPGVTTTPVMIDATGLIWTHETGTAMPGSTAPFLESGPVELGDGDRVARIQRVVPDDKTLGDVRIKIYTSFYPDQAETLHGPYTLGNPTSVRLTARQVRVRLEQVVANAWRVGVVRLGIVMGGRR